MFTWTRVNAPAVHTRVKDPAVTGETCSGATATGPAQEQRTDTMYR
jgi:hypothetical protein